MIREVLQMAEELDAQAAALPETDAPEIQLRKRQLMRDKQELLESSREMTAADRVFLARNIKRPKITDYIDNLFTDFFEQKGDHSCLEDKSILGGIALFKGIPVTVIGHRKGRNLQENIEYNFGMPQPEGYRKAIRLMKQAEKFNRPIISFIDTPGAYPGKEAEEHGQGEAIARSIAEMSRLRVPVISVVTGEGSSGGALALGAANRILMLENAVYSILSPEGFASILWKDSSRSAEAAECMKLTAADLKEFGIIEEIIEEPAGGAQMDPSYVYERLDAALEQQLKALRKLSPSALQTQRYDKFRRIGRFS